MASRSGRFARRTAGSVGLACVVALAGCSSGVEAWRSLSGASKNDPDPATAPFTGNLAAADAAPYPNLASVPLPPSRATSAAERQTLVQSLIADRTAAAQAGAATPAAAQPAPGAASPAGRPAAAPAPLAAAARPVGSAATSPPAPLPSEASLQVPQVRSLPEPETVRPPLPPPRLAAVPPPAAASALAPAIAGAAPQPAPRPPELVPIAPPPAPALAGIRPIPPPAFATVATMDGLDRGQIERVAARYKEQPGSLRILAHAAVPPPGGDPLASYHDALERAHAVAKALAEAGIPAGKIRIEANPASAAKAGGGIEIQFLP